jgi:hypothetical protein
LEGARAPGDDKIISSLFSQPVPFDRSVKQWEPFCPQATINDHLPSILNNNNNVLHLI